MMIYIKFKFIQCINFYPTHGRYFINVSLWDTVISNEDYNKMFGLRRASMKRVETSVHNILKEKRTAAIVKENKKKRRWKIGSFCLYVVSK